MRVRHERRFGVEAMRERIRKMTDAELLRLGIQYLYSDVLVAAARFLA
jgi:hypothetical protein